MINHHLVVFIQHDPGKLQHEGFRVEPSLKSSYPCSRYFGSSIAHKV